MCEHAPSSGKAATSTTDYIYVYKQQISHTHHITDSYYLDVQCFSYDPNSGSTEGREIGLLLLKWGIQTLQTHTAAGTVFCIKFRANGIKTET
jgi:hypothetical protein